MVVVLFWYGLCGLFGSRMHIQGQLMLIGVLMVGKDKRLQWVVLGWAVGFVCKRYTQTFTCGTAVRVLLLNTEKVCDFVCVAGSSDK